MAQISFHTALHAKSALQSSPLDAPSHHHDFAGFDRSPAKSQHHPPAQTVSLLRPRAASQHSLAHPQHHSASASSLRSAAAPTAISPATPPDTAAGSSSASSSTNSPPAGPLHLHRANPSSHSHLQPHAPLRPATARRSLSSPHSLSAAANTAMPANPKLLPTGPGVSAGLDQPRSPPGSKNLNHVPCKFFRQGACQAGKACPFSHNQEPGAEQAPCKYFSKGNCKFGQKCALAHILPDGRRVNHRGGQMFHGHSGLQFGRMDTHHTSHRSALHNSLMQANNVGNHHANHSPHASLGGQEEFPALPGQPIPQIDSIAPSLPQSEYGSPRTDNFPTSPLGTSHRTDRTLGPLDATLPASIDRVDYSHFAKFGPFASSVPNTFGMESPPASLPSSIRGDAAAIQALHRSAFGELNGAAELSRSTRVNGEGESFSERLMMHSGALRRPKMPPYPNSYAGVQSAFTGFKDRERLTDAVDDQDFTFEEDLVPGELADLLTPAERNRRLSRTEEEGPGSFRHSFTAPGTPGDPHLGSPPVGSPGSWGPIITRSTKREEDPQPPSGLGHVGSPLRNSYLHTESAPIHGFQRTSDDISPFTISAPRGAGISALTQSLKRTSISSGEGADGSKLSPNPLKAVERSISSPRLGNGSANATIDEEPECQFSLEVDEDGTSRQVGGFGPSATSATATTNGTASGLGVDVPYMKRK